MKKSPRKSKRVLFHPYLAPRVVFLRKRLKKRQRGIELAIGMSNGMISQIEHGKLGVDLSKVPKLARELKVEPETLAYPGNIPMERLDFLNKIYVLLKNESKTTRLASIEDLVDAAFNEIMKK